MWRCLVFLLAPVLWFMYRCQTGWSAGNQSCSHLVPLPSVFAYYSSLTLCVFEADKAHKWRTVITQLLTFALVSLVAAACDCVFMSKTADFRIVVDGLGVLVPIPERLDRWIADAGIFSIVRRRGLDHMLAKICLVVSKRSTSFTLTSNIRSSPIAGVRGR